MSRDRRIITRKVSKLTIAAVAGTLALATAASAAAATPAPAATPAASRSAGPSPSPAASGSPKSIAQSMLKSFGWSSSQFSCLEPLWAHESNWSVTASNPSTGSPCAAWSHEQADGWY
ncbi:MAG TPA: hypothetical protein VG268_09200 [Streptosporangiaceae bacterium]|nr:hypothetical protein [Streptosporangiaceae bacterium]